MDKLQTILKVPQNKELRQRMILMAQKVVQSKNVQTPPSLNTIEELASDLITELRLDKEFYAFAMVLCGNELWHEIVEATPYNRRLLLLPQCLKNNQSCNAEIDSLGLICAGCKNCQIDEILNVAEELGYATLVAEGTTVAVKLVEEGEIDAVIGVSCMSVLEKSFLPVSKAAVPVIGIPLLDDGCLNTEVDKQWLLSEINAFKSNLSSRPLSISLLKNQISKLFTEENLSATITPDKDIVGEMAMYAMMQGGNRMRPLLTALAYMAYHENPDESILHLLAVIIECFHKASLIHDDIEDGDDYRYEKESLHKKYGISSAINTGDYLIGKGYEVLASLNVDKGVLQKSFKLVSNAHVCLSKGQGEDLVLDADKVLPLIELLEVFRKKTGTAIKVALLLGAVVGNAECEELLVLESFADKMGIAYQIKDDISEFKDCNLDRNIRNYPFIYSFLSNESKENSETVDLFEEGKLKDIIIDVENYLESYIQDIYLVLDGLKNTRLRLSLFGVVGKVFGIERRQK